MSLYVKVFMFDPTTDVELMNQISYSVSPGTTTDISLSVDNVSLILVVHYTNQLRSCDDEEKPTIFM
jgi:hypothetical protein